MGYALLDHRRYTYAGYRHWADDIRYELIDAVAYLMAPATVGGSSDPGVRSWP